MKRVNSQIRLRICGFFMTLATSLIITFGANQARAVHLPDYFPVDPAEHGVKTFMYTYGLSGQYTSEIIGTETVPYTSGDITGVKISNFTQTGTGIIYNDGLNFKFLGSDDYYVSTDCSLTAHPSAMSFSTVTNGMLINPGVYYNVKKDLSTCVTVDNQQILFTIQDVTVLEGLYPDAVIFWWLDKTHPFTALNLYGKESDLGITLPTSSDTGGYSVFAMGIRGFGTGTIAFGEIEASTGSLISLTELKGITYPIGWIFMPPDAPDIGYSFDEGDLLCFFSFGFVQSFDIYAGGWFSHIPMGWVYVNWPFYFESDTSDLWFALPPESGLWVYHFSTNQWTVLPRKIP